MRLIPILCLLLLTLCACNALDFDIPEPDAYLRLQVIFPAEVAQDQQLALFTDSRSATYWTPSDTDIASANRAIYQHLKTLGESAITADFGTYYQQYFGYQVDDTRYIYANYFCDTFDFDWHNDFVFVMDGGNCFFQASYNLLTGKVESLYINGEA